MLVLSRHENSSIKIGPDVRVTVLSARRNHVRLGIEAPLEVPIRRAELATDPRSHAPIDVVQEGAKRSAFRVHTNAASLKLASRPITQMSKSLLAIGERVG